MKVVIDKVAYWLKPEEVPVFNACYGAAFVYWRFQAPDGVEPNERKAAHKAMITAKVGVEGCFARSLELL